MSTETVLMGIIFTVIVPIFLGLLGWILRELISLTKIVASLQVKVDDHHSRLNHIEHIFAPYTNPKREE